MVVRPAHLPHFFVLVACCTGGASAAADGGWWKEESERDLVQTIHIVIFVLVALAFEWCWHKVKHLAADTYAYGEVQIKEQGIKVWNSRNHRRLLVELVDRMGGEFMTLGALAFIIFLLNNFEFFHFLANRIKKDDNFNLPKSAYDWLHEAEIAHMKLFVAMLLYFQTIARLVLASMRKMRKFEKLKVQRLRSVDVEAHKKIMQNSGKPWTSTGRADSADLKEYQGMRTYFLVRVAQWKWKRPDLFHHLCSTIGVDAEDPEAYQKVRQILVDGDGFSFSAYLAGNLGEGITESIHIHFTTWLGIEVIFASFAFFQWFGVPFTTLVWMFAVCAIGVMVAMKYAARRQTANILAWNTLEDPEGNPVCVSNSQNSKVSAEESVHTRLNTERILMRFLQIFTFSVCFVSAATIMKAIFPGGNHGYKPWDIISGLGLLIVVGILGRLQRSVVPRFLVLMALPPNVNEDNFEVLISTSLRERNQNWQEDALMMAHKSSLHEMLKQVTSEGTDLENPAPANAQPRSSPRCSPRSSRLTGRPGDENLNSARLIWELAAVLGKTEELERRMVDPSAARHRSFMSI